LAIALSLVAFFWEWFPPWGFTLHQNDDSKLALSNVSNFLKANEPFDVGDQE
jgi:hypothetical protein